jgi:hypothetical protein
MADDQALSAMHRIEAALARIEKAVDQPGDAPDERLRDGVRALIAGLDRMIASEESKAG